MTTSVSNFPAVANTVQDLSLLSHTERLRTTFKNGKTVTTKLALIESPPCNRERNMPLRKTMQELSIHATVQYSPGPPTPVRED